MKGIREHLLLHRVDFLKHVLLVLQKRCLTRTYLNESLELVILDAHICDWVKSGDPVGESSLDLEDRLPESFSTLV